jgi:hypothetical protein
MSPFRILTTALVLMGPATAAWATNPELSLTPDSSCYQIGATVTVNVDLLSHGPTIVGGQFTLSYDKNSLSFVSADPAPSVWTVKVYESVSATNGTIDYAVGIPSPPDPNSSGATSGTMAVLKFTASAGICNAADLVSFRVSTPPTKIADSQNHSYYGANLTLHNLPATSIDSTPPVISPSASDQTVECDGFGNTAAFNNWLSTHGGASASDGCGGTVNWSNYVVNNWVTDCGGAKHVEVVFAATDACGNYSTTSATFTIVDTTPPVVTRDPSNKTVECDGNGNTTEYAAWLAGVGGDGITTGGLATDACGTVTWTDNSTTAQWANDCGGTKHIQITFTASDGCAANNVTKTATFTIEDTTPPAATKAGEIGTCYATQALAEEAALTKSSATDPCAGTLTPHVSTAGDCSATITVYYTDDCGNASNNLTYTTRIDNTPPVVTPPEDITVPADAGGCSASVSFSATADDACDGSRPVVFKIGNTVITSPYPFPSGTTTVTVESTDSCGNTGSAMFHVTVSGFFVVVDVQLGGAGYPASLTRCITFELFDCPSEPLEVSQQVTFNYGLAANVEVSVPCGSYSCITARDKLHTLRRTASLSVPDGGTQYKAYFTDDPATGGDWLIGGNLDDDDYIDIFDFAIYINSYGTDFQTGFFKGNELNCCALPYLPAGPRTSITCAELRRLGRGDLVIADLNNDGVVDQWDIVAFMNGTRPLRRAEGALQEIPSSIGGGNQAVAAP